jgi:hypothetical protein
MPYELPNMIMAILCNSYVVDPYFIGWPMRCEPLSCSWCMSRCILLPYSCYLLTRVNSANVQDEGLRIGRRERRMNSKVNIRQTRRGLMCNENKHSNQLAQSQYVPVWPLLAPLYRWPGLEEPVGFNTNYNVCIHCHLVFWLHLCLGLF